MVPLVVLALVAVALVAAVLAVASGRLAVDPLADAVHTTPDTGLPPAPVAADVDSVRFDTALRGYRTDDVDARLDDLRDTLAAREATLVDLGGSLTQDPQAPTVPEAPSVPQAPPEPPEPAVGEGGADERPSPPEA